MASHRFSSLSQLIEFFKSGFLFDPQNYLTLLSVANLMTFFPACAWTIEKLASWGYLSDFFVMILEISYLTCMLAYPIVLI